ncbi:MAG: DUF1284 domain-containing protein [Bacillota bacterium]|nr:DUF1284 domain-containing protein [Bacillota bacterium]
MINFRGHHLICLHFFRGEGYGRDFVKNLEDLVSRAENDEIIFVCAGADHVCRSCPSLLNNICTQKNGADEEIKKLDNSALDFLNLAVGEKVLWSEIKKKINSAPRKWFISFCEGCGWENVCKKIQT